MATPSPGSRFVRLPYAQPLLAGALSAASLLGLRGSKLGSFFGGGKRVFESLSPGPEP